MFESLVVVLWNASPMWSLVFLELGIVRILTYICFRPVDCSYFGVYAGLAVCQDSRGQASSEFVVLFTALLSTASYFNIINVCELFLRIMELDWNELLDRLVSRLCAPVSTLGLADQCLAYFRNRWGFVPIYFGLITLGFHFNTVFHNQVYILV